MTGAERQRRYVRRQRQIVWELRQEQRRADAEAAGLDPTEIEFEPEPGDWLTNEPPTEADIRRAMFTDEALAALVWKP